MIVYFHNSSHLTTSNVHSTSKKPQNKKPSNSSPTPNATTSSPNNTVSPVAPSNSGTGSQTLLAPFGSFVSNHNPSLSNSSKSYELSTCETTPGASCYIEFTNSAGHNIVLPAQTANSQGVVSWGWSVSSKGFTIGSWSITAVATLNGQTKTSLGSSLNVQQ